MSLKGKKILFGVSGGIAAYKVVQVARDLTKAGADVHILMTEAATRFVTPLTFQTLTLNPVHTDLWEPWTKDFQGHITLSEVDLAVVAPATADIIAKIALGICDNVITTTLLASTAPLMVVPAMDGGMYTHPATQKNLETLKERGVYLLEPEYGLMASGLVGKGRLPEPPVIFAAIKQYLGKLTGKFSRKNIVITAGGTQEAIDPVRFIGNGSSGQMGYALAQTAVDEGANVTLISGPVKLDPPHGVRFVPVKTALEMEKAVHSALLESPFGKADVLIMAAAVADFRPVSTSHQKIKKDGAPPTIELALNPDILAGLKQLKNIDGLFKVGFAAETNDLTINAEKKLAGKSLDLIVANEAVSTIGQADSEAILLERGGLMTQLPRKPKADVAVLILDKIHDLLVARQKD
jgi:phosphopantothenoylcysteine decarboxylase / phosphopantothenate---cysteine ligase